MVHDGVGNATVKHCMVGIDGTAQARFTIWVTLQTMLTGTIVADQDQVALAQFNKGIRVDDQSAAEAHMGLLVTFL